MSLVVARTRLSSRKQRVDEKVEDPFVEMDKAFTSVIEPLKRFKTHAAKQCNSIRLNSFGNEGKSIYNDARESGKFTFHSENSRPNLSENGKNPYNCSEVDNNDLNFNFHTLRTPDNNEILDQSHVPTRINNNFTTYESPEQQDDIPYVDLNPYEGESDSVASDQQSEDGTIYDLSYGWHKFSEV